MRKRMTPEERLEGIPHDQLRQKLTPEERLEGITPEQRLEGLTSEDLERIRQLLNNPPKP